MAARRTNNRRVRSSRKSDRRTKSKRSKKSKRSTKYKSKRSTKYTKRSTVQRPMNGVKQGAVYRMKSVHFIGKPTAKPVKGASTLKFYDQYFDRLYADEGQQGSGLLGVVGFTGDLTSTAVLGNPALYSFGTAIDPFNLNPNLYTTGSVDFTAGTQLTADFVNFHNCHLKFSFSNFLTSTAVIDFYLVRPKTDGNNTCTTEWAAMLQNMSAPPYITPATNQTSGGSGQIGHPTVEYLGLKPNQLETWNRRFDIIAKKSIDFTADTQVEWDLDLYYNKRMDLNYMLGVKGANPNGYLRDTTIFLMYVARGQVIRDLQTEGYEVSTSSVQIGYTCSRSYTFSPAEGARARNEVALPNLITGAALSEMRQISTVDTAITIDSV